MSGERSPGTGEVYGVRRVCAAGGLARSSFYDRRDDDSATTPPPASRKKRGPRTQLSDDDLLDLIREDLATSPFRGEGHRKVWMRLGRKGVGVGRKRVLRLMRVNHLLSPHRCAPASGPAHTGRIVTDEPNAMWGTDGLRVLTAEEGWGWTFVAVEHWNAECVGWHVCKRGDRFAALEPVTMGVRGIFGSVEADVARGLELRHDHGSQYLSEHFGHEVRFLGMTPSYAIVSEPETNGVAERFVRTLREQVFHGRIFRNLEEVREAVRTFVRLYNEQWLVEKRGFLSPKEARERWEREKAA
jgi:transposase InsO family protein